jgi:protoporphyrinogen oxidase
MGQLYEALAREVTRLGGEVRTDARVTGLETNGGRVTAVSVEVRGERERVPVGELLSTIPLPLLVRSLVATPTPATAHAIDRLRFRALVFLNVPLARHDFSENTWTYVASRGLSISRIQEPKRRSPSMAPEGRTSIMLEIPCDAGDATWHAEAPELSARATAELGKLGFSMGDALSSFVVRVAHGYPIYEVGYETHRRALLDEVARFSNVQTAGRQGLFRYVFMDAAMQMGKTAAERMLAGGRVGPSAMAELDAIGRSTAVIETRAITA